MRSAVTPSEQNGSVLKAADVPGLPDQPVVPAGTAEHQSSASTGEVEPALVHQPAVKQEKMVLQQQGERQAKPAHAAPAATTPPSAAAAAPTAGEAEEVDPLHITIDSKERLRWSPQLHQRFCQAVTELGGSPFAKPKDIMIKMNVPGLTLAHVKSHLQKFRQHEGVTYVPHSTRNLAGAARSFQLQQMLQEQQHWHANAGSGNSSSASDGGAPAHKRTRAAASTRTRGACWAEHFQPQPQQHGSRLASAVATSAATEAAAIAAAAEPFQHCLKTLGASTAQAGLAHTNGGVQEGALDKLHTLAELAAVQHDELMAAQRPVEEQAAVLAPLQEGLAALPQHRHWAAQASELHARLDVLAVQQVPMHAAVQQHLHQGAMLMKQLRAFHHAAHELLGSALAQPAQQQQQQPMSMVAAASAALHAASEQHQHTDAPGLPGPQQPAVPPHLATQLLAVMAAAAAATRDPGFMPPPATPQPPATTRGAAAELAQLQQLYQDAVMLAARKAV